MSQRNYPIVVVGAGISGLAVGYYLRLAGEEVVILESAAEPGGLIESRRDNGYVLELGPQRTRLTSPLRALVDSLDLSDELITAPDLPLYVFADGKLREVPMDFRSVLTTDLLSWWDRARALAEPLTDGVIDGESTADFFIRKFGYTAYNRLFGPLFGDLFGSDPAEMPACHALASYLRTLGIEGSLLSAMIRGLRGRGGAPTCTFQNGVQTLTDKMAERLGDRVQTSTPVHEIYRNGSGLCVVTDEEDLRAAHVVMTCPAPAASRVLAPLDAETTDALTSLHYNTLAVVHLHAEQHMDAMGYELALDSNYATRGVTYNDALFERSGIYTAFLGGANHPDVPQLSDKDLGTLAAREFEAVTGAESSPLSVHRTEMPAWDTSWNALEGFRSPEDISICATWQGRPGITARLGEAAELAGHLTATS